MNFFLSYVTLSAIYAILAMSTNLLVGLVGIFSVSQAAIFGVGAYLVAGMTLTGTLGFVPAVVLAMALCAALNLALILPSLRVAGDYFVVTSFGSQLVATALFVNLVPLTGGASGLSGIPPARVLGQGLILPGQTALLALAAMALAALAFWLMMRASFGRLVNAVRLDERALRAAGKPVMATKLKVAGLAGALAALAGGLYAANLSYIDPVSFDIHVSILILTMMVLGGARTLAGSILGPFVLLALPQLLSVIDLPSGSIGPIRQLIYGALLIAFMLFRPQGIVGQRI